MKLVIPGRDIIDIDDKFTYPETSDKVHLIRFIFSEPTEAKIQRVIKEFPFTNRFIVKDNIKFYNSVLKNTNKKYYIENTKDSDFISFLRKNNKILCNFLNLHEDIQQVVLDKMFSDLLRNCEVILLNKRILALKEEDLKNWKGHVILK